MRNCTENQESHFEIMGFSQADQYPGGCAEQAEAIRKGKTGMIYSVKARRLSRFSLLSYLFYVIIIVSKRMVERSMSERNMIDKVLSSEHTISTY